MVDRDEEKQIIVIEEEEEEEEQPEEVQKEKEEKKERETEAAGEEEGPQGFISGFKLDRRVLGIIVTVGMVGLILFFFVFKSSHRKTSTKKITKAHIEKKKPSKGFVKRVSPKPVHKPRKVVVKKYNPYVDVHFVNALRLEEQGKYRAAITELKYAIKNFYVSYNSIGMIYLKLGNIKMAREYMLDRVREYLLLSLENNPNCVSSYVNLFRIYMIEGNYPEAEEILKTLSRKCIGKKELALMRLYYKYMTGHVSLEQLYSALDKFPDEPLLYNLIGTENLKNGNTRQAVFYLKKALGLYSDNTALYNLGLVYAQEHRYGDAYSLLKSAFLIQFSKIPYRDYLTGLILVRYNNAKGAFRYLRFLSGGNKIALRFKITPFVDSRLGPKEVVKKSYINSYVAAQVIADYLQPFTFSPRRQIEEHMDFGYIYQTLNIFNRARKEYSKSAKYSIAILLSERAKILFLRGRIKQSLNLYKKALSMFPGNPVLLYNTAIMYLKVGDLKHAEALLNKLNNNYPSFIPSLVALSVLHQLKGDHDGFLSFAHAFVRDFSSVTDERIRKSLANLYLVEKLVYSGKWDRALFGSISDADKEILMMVKAALDGDLAFLGVQRRQRAFIHCTMNMEDYYHIFEYVLKHYPSDKLRRAAYMYFILKNKPVKAYESLYGLKNYTAADYYHLGIAYLLSGYTEIANNFFTKSLLVDKKFYQSYISKAIIQAMMGKIDGVKYYIGQAKSYKPSKKLKLRLSFNIDII